jgi:hypothetical protein
LKTKESLISRLSNVEVAMPPINTPDPDKIAYYEKSGWEAYYDRNWPLAVWLLVQLNREAFQMPWLTAIGAALDSVRAAIAFAPLDNNIPKVTRHLEKFYARARRTMGLKPGARALAELELDYWIIHRELAIQRRHRPENDGIEPLIDSLARLHAALFDSTPEAMRPSARMRALSAKAVDRITSRTSTDVEADWREVEHYLQQAYRAVEAARQ